MHASLQQKELVVQERDVQIQQLSTQLREKDERLEQREAQLQEIIQRKNADISTLQREIQILQVSKYHEEFQMMSMLTIIIILPCRNL